MSTGMLALKLTIMGMGTVFVILSLLGLMMHCFKLFFEKETKADAGPMPEAPERIPTQSEEQEELVAVIAAASHFARMRWKRPVLVKTVTPVWDEKNQSSWLEAGRREIINSRLGLRRFEAATK